MSTYPAQSAGPRVTFGASGDAAATTTTNTTPDVTITTTEFKPSPVMTGIVMLSTALSAYHGYRRNQSIGWGIGWGVLGSIAPVITPAIAFAQGFGKPRTDLARKNPGKAAKRSRRAR